MQNETEPLAVLQLNLHFQLLQVLFFSAVLISHPVRLISMPGQIFLILFLHHPTTDFTHVNHGLLHPVFLPVHWILTETGLSLSRSVIMVVFSDYLTIIRILFSYALFPMSDR